MKRQDIFFRATKVASNLINRNLQNFFNRADLINNKFVKLSISYYKDNQLIVLIGETVVNREDKIERLTLIRNLILALNLKYISLTKGDQLTIFYEVIDSNTYSSYKNSLSKRFLSSLVSNNLGRRINLGKRFYSTDSSKNSFTSDINKKDNNNSKFNNPNNNKNDKIKQIILNIISIIFIIFVLFNFIYSLNIYNFVGIFISVIISYLITTFVLNNFKYSNNKIVKFLQKFIIYNFIIIITISMCYYLNLYFIPEANCHGDEITSQDTVSDNNSVSSNTESNSNKIFRGKHRGLLSVVHLPVRFFANNNFRNENNFNKEINNNLSNNLKNSNNSNKSNNKNDKIKQFILNTISVIFLSFIGYKFIMGLTVGRLYAFIISFIISSLISSFFMNYYKFSNNKVVRFLQKFVIFNIIIIVALIICDYFNIHLLSEARCDGTDENKNENNNNNNNNNYNNNNNNNNNNNDNSNNNSGDNSGDNNLIDLEVETNINIVCDREILEKGLNELRDLIKETQEESNLNDFENNLLNSSSFSESFPDYIPNTINYTDSVFENSENSGNSGSSGSSLKSENSSSSIFKNVQTINELLKGNDNLLITNFLRKKGLSYSIQNVEELITDTSQSITRAKPLGKFGDYTLNDICNKGSELIGPITEAVKNSNVNIDGEVAVDLVSFMLMYKSICYTHSKIIKSYNPSTTPISKMNKETISLLNSNWARDNRKFQLIAAPLLVGSLYLIKRVVLANKFRVTGDIEVNVDINKDINKQSLFLFVLKKLSNFYNKIVKMVGSFIILIISVSLTQFVLKNNSINLLEPFYIKYIISFCIIVSSILALDYLIKYSLYKYYKFKESIEFISFNYIRYY